jgi:UDP-GlcNAc:undecaprenyl-phosphate/decaprenyl-phosphate GlcNAc-1-phosphate transferase
VALATLARRMILADIAPGLALAFLCGLGGAYGMARWRILVDQPNARSSHSLPTPRGGGVGLVAGTLLAGAWFAQPVAGAIGIAAGAAIAAAAGLADDARAQGAYVKFGAQFFATALAMAGGAIFDVVHVPGIGPVALGLFAIPVTFLWFVGLTNAYNFMDGLDALAGSTGLVAAAFAGLFLVLAASCAGFLPFNLPRARIFMGDVGSQFLGFCFAGLGVLAANVEDGGRLFWLVPILLMHFLFDTIATAIRRAANGENVLAAHRSHLYQRLNQSGVSHGRVAALLAAMAAAQGLCVFWLPLSVHSALVAAFGVQLAYAAFVLSRAKAQTP